MAKVWRKEHPFPWICNDSEDDFRADMGEYLLRVEHMDTGHWWWRVYYMEEAIPTELNEHATTRDNAIGRAEGVYLAHKLMNNKNEIRFFKSSI
jgi:hypothetical protein